METKKRVTIDYCCRASGYGEDAVAEEGSCTGEWTGEVDTWGKYTFQPDWGAPLYLFADEVVGQEDAPLEPGEADDLEVLASHDCGCRAVQYADYDTALEFCPLHQAADDLRAAATVALDCLNWIADGAGDVAEWNEGGEFYEACVKLRTALVKAGRKEVA